MEQTPYIPERALVIAAHCDDIEFGAAGTVAKWTEAGAQVTYCIVTDGSAGSNNPETDLRELVVIRQAEQRASAEAVGVTDVRFWDYPDGILEPTMALRKDLTRLIRQVRPNLVMSFDPETMIYTNPDYINHPDHMAVAQATLYAVFPSAGARPIFPDLLAEGLEPHDIDKLYFFLSQKPTHFVDITPYHEHKLAALRCHASQLNDEVFEMVTKWDSALGVQVGVEYAESFRVMTFREPNLAG